MKFLPTMKIWGRVEAENWTFPEKFAAKQPLFWLDLSLDMFNKQFKCKIKWKLQLNRSKNYPKQSVKTIEFIASLFVYFFSQPELILSA
jgi:hypothetical protein